MKTAVALVTATAWVFGLMALFVVLLTAASSNMVSAVVIGACVPALLFLEAMRREQKGRGHG